MRGWALAWLASFSVGACGGPDGASSRGPGPARPVVWEEGAWTQPVPEWGSPVRLDLPVSLASIVFGPGGGFGAFGAHQGGHVEGLNHIWIPVVAGTPIRSWADGTVTRIDDMGDRGTGDGRREYFITINYGQGLVGKHLDVDVPLVKVGDQVRRGEPVATGPSAEFMLVDENRSDGERFETGSPVSPFDYLRDEVRQAVVAAHRANMVAPFFEQGLAAGNSRPWEPYLTNRMLFHQDHPDSPAGEWILVNKGWQAPDPDYFEVLAIFDVDNQYGHFQRFEAMDHDWSAPGNKRSATGSWRAGEQSGQLVWALKGSTGKDGTYYSWYRVDESQERATLILEWRRDAFPESLSAGAAVYVERTATYLWDDTHRLGLQ
ncbi:MAG: M23 family metallopeptidase [Candidatus Latescibacteria bacterium]|nr:M23 family metallopeptidase [Candidatus Latescibacterota bacterium]